MASLLDILKKQKISGALSIPVEGETAAHTIPLFPGVSIATVPTDRDVTPEEARHESLHAMGGLPLAMAGTVGSALTGIPSWSKAYLSPDEAAGYLVQPSSEATTQDMSTLQSEADAASKETKNPLGRGYLALVKALAAMRQGK